MPAASSSSSVSVAASFALLCAASVTLTLGNKWLMVRGGLAAHDHLIVLLQNAFAVAVISGAAALGFVRILAVNRRQAIFYAWDALVLVVQLWTSFKALQHLPVSATSVVPALSRRSGTACDAMWFSRS